MGEPESRRRSFIRFWRAGRRQALVTALFVAGCAHVEPPPGGPVDKIPPYVVGVFPAPAQTEVSRDAEITLKFSEWVRSEGIQSRVALSPTLPGKVRVESDGDQLVFRHDSLFRENTTYRMVLPVDLKDMNGVALDSAFELVFSTGKAIDSGVLEGRFFQWPKGKLQQAWVALYSHNRQGLVARRGEKRKAPWPDSVVQAWREKPTYLTSVDSSGGFRFGALAPGRYGVLGFMDANQNQLPDNGEAMGIGPAGILIGDVTPPDLSMRMAPLDTQKLRLTKVTWVPATDSSEGFLAGALKVGFNRFPAWNKAELLDAFLVSPVTTEQGFKAFRAQPEASAMSPEGDLELWFPKLPANQRLMLKASQLTDAEGLPLDTSRSSLTFEAVPPPAGNKAMPKWTLWNTDASTRKPMSFTKENLPPVSSLLLRADMPIPDSLFRAWSGKWELKVDSIPVSLSSKREGPYGVRLSWSLPKKSLKSFSLARLPDTASSPADSSKAKPPSPTQMGQWVALDSTQWSSIKLKPDSHWLGWTGILRRESSDDSRQFRLGTGNEIKIDSLVPGVWRLSVYADQNGSGSWNSGSLYPWQSQEPTAYWTDSLKLEAGQAAGPVSIGPNRP
jgi:Bacterial Ig-like domain